MKVKRSNNKRLETYSTKKSVGKKKSSKNVPILASIIVLLAIVSLVPLSITFDLPNFPEISSITGLSTFNPPQESNENLQQQNPSKAPLNSDEKALPQGEFNYKDLEQNNLIQDLPKSASIHLVIGIKDYTVEKSSVTEGVPEEKDLIIEIPSKYAYSLTQDFCSTLRLAEENSELSITPKKSKASLSWKYRSMLKYKSCLGI